LRSIAGGFEKEENRVAFRAELLELQKDLRRYTGLLAQIAQVEDLTAIAFQ
jgi:hypothetical protein